MVPVSEGKERNLGAPRSPRSSPYRWRAVSTAGAMPRRQWACWSPSLRGRRSIDQLHLIVRRNTPAITSLRQCVSAMQLCVTALPDVPELHEPANQCVPGPRRDPRAISDKKNGRNPKVPAKFEQGGFTSGRRKGPQTLFPGTGPGNLPR